MELPNVGQHCNLSHCNSLDFLPIVCPLCKHVFCEKHRLPLDHDCSQWNLVNKQLIQCHKCLNLINPPSLPKLSPEQTLKEHLESDCKIHLYQEPNSKVDFDRKCTVQDCYNIDPRIGPVRCDGCRQDFCLRHPSAHSCESLLADEKRKAERKLAAQEKVAKTFKVTTKIEKAQTIKPVPVKSKNGGMVELMKMKSQAKGDLSVPIASRLYIYVQCPKESFADSLSVFFDKKITVGRMLDTLADMCKINNKNNIISDTDPERLYIYKCPEMTVMDNSTRLEKAFKNLDTILLERQGALSMNE
ncbi:hypothetical protein RMCBS344292_02070 [Rhizopus microsporus]|nr:hypothetical protein RMCBS344292_02070 [Rhizopus microsporus]